MNIDDFIIGTMIGFWLGMVIFMSFKFMIEPQPSEYAEQICDLYDMDVQDYETNPDGFTKLECKERLEKIEKEFLILITDKVKK